MKKIILAIAALALIAAPAMAVDWNFYGSARVVSWYVDEDLGDGTTVAGDDDDSGIRWGTVGQDNSRFGARVKAENVSGRVEIQLRGEPGGDPSTSITTESRLIYGDWDFGAGKLRVGKAYTPVSQFISGQAFDEDIGLLGIGTAYGNRIAGLQLMFGGLTVALLEVNDNQVGGTTGDVDVLLPKIEASYAMSFDMFNFSVMGGYQSYEIEGPGALGVLTDDIDVDSYIIGATAGVNFGPAYVKGAVSYGENTSNAAWPSFYTAAAAATLNAAGDDVDDAEMLQFALVGGFKFTDQVTFEAGFGWHEVDSDAPGTDEDAAWAAYGQAVISLAPGVYIVPEIGYFDFEEDFAGDDEGNQFYAGAKWQIDF
jgi:hypothetical protein